MTATLASTARTSVVTGTGARRLRGAAPKARPELGGPSATPLVRSATRRPATAASCRVVSPTARRAGMLMKLKVSVVAVVALVGVGVSTAEFASWSQVDPAVEFVAGDPAWAHVTSR